MNIFEIMKKIRSVFKAYIRWHLHVSMAVTAFAGITATEFDLHMPFWFWIFIFLGSLLGYNFITHTAIVRMILDLFRKSLPIQIMIVLTGILVFVGLWQLSLMVTVTLCILAIITLLYALPFRKNRNLRSLAGLKVFLVAAVWAGVTVLVPLEMVGESLLSQAVILTFIQRFLIVVLLMIPFEIRDFGNDAPELDTFPQKYGIRKTKIFGMIGVVAVLFIEIIKDSGITYLGNMLVFLLLLSVSIAISSENQARYFSSFWVEGLPICWFLVLQLSLQTVLIS